METASRSTSRRFEIERHPAEKPLFAVVVVAATLFWLLMALSIVGLIYAVALGLFFFVSHLVFVARVRGSGVKLGSEQFPELRARVVSLASEMDMTPPDAYLMQAGGALNALATRFLRRDMIILYSDLLEACEGEPGARDMIIAHELAHLRLRHLKWAWYTLPGHFIPFLGAALSRAREYTCDRYGAAAAGDVDSAVLGLTVLAAGPRYAPLVSRTAFVRQRHDVNTGVMTLGEWFSSHPPLSKRIAAIDSRISDPAYSPARGRVRAASVVLAAGGAAAAVVAVAIGFGSALLEGVESAAGETTAEAVGEVEATRQVAADFEALGRFLEANWTVADAPESMEEVRLRWESVSPELAFPTDPFDGYEYGYAIMGHSYELLSSGPDGEPYTEDDLLHQGRFPR